MISDEERREVAARLRKAIGLHEFAEVLGFDWTDDSDWGWGDVSNLVADLIEPEPERTCRMVRTGEPSPTGVPRERRCSLCGGMLTRFGAYCHNCGARVVD